MNITCTSTGLHVLCVPKDYKIVLVQATDQTKQAIEQIKWARPGALNVKLPMLHV